MTPPKSDDAAMPVVFATIYLLLCLFLMGPSVRTDVDTCLCFIVILLLPALIIVLLSPPLRPKSTSLMKKADPPGLFSRITRRSLEDGDEYALKMISFGLSLVLLVLVCALWYPEDAPRARPPRTFGGAPDYLLPGFSAWARSFPVYILVDGPLFLTVVMAIFIFTSLLGSKTFTRIPPPIRRLLYRREYAAIRDALHSFVDAEVDAAIDKLQLLFDETILFHSTFEREDESYFYWSRPGLSGERIVNEAVRAVENKAGDSFFHRTEIYSLGDKVRDRLSPRLAALTLYSGYKEEEWLLPIQATLRQKLDLYAAHKKAAGERLIEREAKLRGSIENIAAAVQEYRLGSMKYDPEALDRIEHYDYVAEYVRTKKAELGTQVDAYMQEVRARPDVALSNLRQEYGDGVLALLPRPQGARPSAPQGPRGRRR
jgi:hypothetical protein